MEASREIGTLLESEKTLEKQFFSGINVENRTYNTIPSKFSYIHLHQNCFNCKIGLRINKLGL